MSDRLPHISPIVMKELIGHYEARGMIGSIESCIPHVDVGCLDVHQVVVVATFVVVNLLSPHLLLLSICCRHICCCRHRVIFLSAFAIHSFIHSFCHPQILSSADSVIPSFDLPLYPYYFCNSFIHSFFSFPVLSF